MKADWPREFDEPIPLPKGRQLVTLRDAGDYITKLPKAEHTAPKWQAAMEALILVATLGGPTMFARIGIMKALNRRRERLFSERKERIGESANWHETANPSSLCITATKRTNEVNARVSWHRASVRPCPRNVDHATTKRLHLLFMGQRHTQAVGRILCCAS
jgi:hypothetical protein